MKAFPESLRLDRKRMGSAPRRVGTLLAILVLGGAGIFAMPTANVHAQQTLARGVTMSDMGAVKQTDTNVTTLHATAVNNSGKPIALLTARFQLYDANNQIIGEATTSQANMAPGETWKISVDTPVQFTRFTLMNVDAQ